MEFLKHMGDIGINSGLIILEDSFVKLGEDEVVIKMFYGTGVFHVPVPVIENKFYQYRHIPPDRYWSWLCRFIAFLHYNIRCYLGRFPY